MAQFSTGLDTVGRPGEGIWPRYNWTSRCRSFIVAITSTSIVEVLRRPVESAQFTSWAFTRRALDSGLVPSMGSIGDCYDSGMMESFWARMQVEPLNQRRWRTRLELANAIFDYVEILNNVRGVTHRWGCSPRSNTNDATNPAPEFKPANRAKPGTHVSLHQTRGGSDDVVANRLIDEATGAVRGWVSDLSKPDCMNDDAGSSAITAGLCLDLVR